MQSSNIELSKRLERAEGYACSQFAEARKRLFPDCDSQWMECAGAYAVYDGIDSPVTQTFGLGLFQELTDNTLDTLEEFFAGFGAAVMHELSPFAGVSAMSLLCKRKYKPVELSSVLYRKVEKPKAAIPMNINVRVIDTQESDLWAELSARGWTHEHPELKSFIHQIGSISVVRENSIARFPRRSAIRIKHNKNSCRHNCTVQGRSNTCCSRYFYLLVY